ncbi:MAG: hypothetical protein OEO20_11490 [Gemmatimonadota bacterium]|nr:hypothetical protein [Gemmatimonadota bacterium]MDH3366528.1 hypothetical protein [Gemmatimonadota bacterium]MDH3478917.1 hypothetical protein [Gemmatimonadota bacterium]MDH3571152.1 hypothetical protein [Gemmatimonadota bacterium]
MLEHNGETIRGGRVIRTVLAIFLILVSAAMLIVKFVVIPLKTSAMPSIELTESIFHLLVIVVAVVVYDHRTGKALFAGLGNLKLPFGGK